MPLTDPVPSSSFDVLQRNVQDTDKFVNQETGTFTNRVGKVIKPIPVIESEANAAVISLGWHQVGLFADGFTYLLQNDIAKDASGDWYRWNGSLPKVVSAGTLPSSDANFVKIDYKSHAELSDRNPADGSAHNADDVAKNGGGSVQGFIDEVDTLYAKISGQTFTGPISATGIKSLTKYGSVIIGDNPVGVSEADFPSPTSLRDAVNVSRKLVNSATDCHAFADKTIIENASDYGGYGAVDVTTILRGNNVHNHVAAYQDRFGYEGSGTLENSWGFILWPTATGSGTVEKRVGIQLRGISTTTATVESNRGIDIDPKNSLDENIGVIVRNGVCANSQAISYNSAQDANGYTFYTSSFGKMKQQGQAGFGAASPTSTPFTFSAAELGSTVFGAFSADTANGAFVAASGDSRVSFISNLSLLGGWGNSTDSKCFYANASTQNLGKDSKRWGTVYLVTAPNVSSDERFKNFEDVSDLEIKCALEVKKAIRKYRLKSGDVKIHFGVSAQEIVKIFSIHGLLATDYNIVQIDKDGHYSVCYEELLIFIAMGI